MMGLLKTFRLSGRSGRAEFWAISSVVLAAGMVLLTSEIPLSMLWSIGFNIRLLPYVIGVLLIVGWPLYAALVRRYRDAGLPPWAGMVLPAYVVSAPPIALLIDQSPIGLWSPTRGLPEVVYAGFGYLLLLFVALIAANLPSRSHEVTP